VDLPKRTIRYYIYLGLVDWPDGKTQATRYEQGYLEQLLGIRQRTQAGLWLEPIPELLSAPAEPPPVTGPALSRSRPRRPCSLAATGVRGCRRGSSARRMHADTNRPIYHDARGGGRTLRRTRRAGRQLGHARASGIGQRIESNVAWIQKIAMRWRPVVHAEELRNERRHTSSGWHRGRRARSKDPDQYLIDEAARAARRHAALFGNTDGDTVVDHDHGLAEGLRAEVSDRGRWRFPTAASAMPRSAWAGCRN
jgi:DNA-binding transcriptional MerR regulator